MLCDSQTFQDTRADQRIKQRKVKCSQRDSGCTEEPELGCYEVCDACIQTVLGG